MVSFKPDIKFSCFLKVSRMKTLKIIKLQITIKTMKQNIELFVR